jgi:hypothetical protein
MPIYRTMNFEKNFFFEIFLLVVEHPIQDQSLHDK